MRQDLKKALEIVYKEERGTINDLKESITTEMVKKLISVGFIICGYTHKAKTWRISLLGKEYCEDFVL